MKFFHGTNYSPKNVYTQQEIITSLPPGPSQAIYLQKAHKSPFYPFIVSFWTGWQETYTKQNVQITDLFCAIFPREAASSDIVCRKINRLAAFVELSQDAKLSTEYDPLNNEDKTSFIWLSP